MSPEPPASQAGDGAQVTPLGAHRTSVADLQREVERLTAALHEAEQRRRTAEHTLGDVARMAAADAADLRARIATLEEERDATGLTGGRAGVARDPAPPGRRAGRVRHALLLAGLMLGLLICADGIATIVWQEPLTALVQSRDQAALRDDLGRLQRTFAAAPKVAREDATQRIERQAGALLDSRPAGRALGSIRIPRIGLKSVFVESTGHDALAKGPGHYKGTTLPGLPGTVGLAGHRTTYGAPFRHVDNLPKGSRIEVRMPYGRFIYRVTGTQITTPDDAAALRSRTGAHLLVLTACHPLYSAAKRIVVTAHQTYAEPA